MSYYEYLEVCADHWLDPQVVFEDYPYISKLTVEELHEFLSEVY